MSIYMWVYWKTSIVVNPVISTKSKSGRIYSNYAALIHSIIFHCHKTEDCERD